MGKNKKENSIKIIKENKSDFTFTRDETLFLLETKSDNNEKDKSK